MPRDLQYACDDGTQRSLPSLSASARDIARAEEDTAEAACRRLLAKARCTVDYQAGAALLRTSAEARVEFIMRQLYLLGVSGYTREQVNQLVRDNFSRE